MKSLQSVCQWSRDAEFLWLKLINKKKLLAMHFTIKFLIKHSLTFIMNIKHLVIFKWIPCLIYTFCYLLTAVIISFKKSELIGNNLFYPWNYPKILKNVDTNIRLSTGCNACLQNVKIIYQVNVVIRTINLMITVQIFKKITATIILRNSDNISYDLLSIVILLVYKI